MQQQVDEVFMSDEIRRYIVDFPAQRGRTADWRWGCRPVHRWLWPVWPRRSLPERAQLWAPQDVTAIFADATHHRLRLTEQGAHRRRDGGEHYCGCSAHHTAPPPEKPSHGR